MHTKLTPPTMKERNIVFLQDFLSWNMKQCNKSQCSTFCLIVPSLFKEVLHIIQMQTLNITKMIHTIMVFAQSTISQDWNFNVNPLIISFRLNQFTNGFTKTFIRKIWAEILLWYFRHDYCKWKILGKVGGCQRFIVKSFDPTLWITKFCCRVVPDDRFGVLNNPTCTNVGFSLSSLSREEGIWRKVTTKFSCSRLAVDI